MKIHDIITERFLNLFQDDPKKQQYKQTVFDMLTRTYAAIGGIKGSGFGSPDEMVEKIPLWKLATKNGKLVAVVLYKDSNGRKSVASGTDGSEEGKTALSNMVGSEPARSYAEKSKAALNLAMKSLTAQQQQQYLIPIDRVKTILDEPIVPVDGLSSDQWPVDDPEEISATELTLAKYPQLVKYGYFRKLGSDYKFKVMLGTPNLPVKKL